MFKQLTEAVRAMSYRTVLKTNILSLPGSSAGGSKLNMGLGNGARNGSPSSALANRHLLSTFYLKHQELKDYQSSELTRTALTIYKDYLIGYFTDSPDIIELSEDVPDREQAQAKINYVLNQIEYVNEVKEHLDDYLYYDGYSFKLGWDQEEAKWKKFTFANPCSIVQVNDGGVLPKSYLVVSKQGVIYEVDPCSVMSFGRPQIDLENDMATDYFGESEEDSLICDVTLSSGNPLYFDNSAKVKEYLLKEQILSLLSIKDLVQPLLLLLRVDGNTAPDEANKLALNVENLINKYSDISSILGAQFSISELMDSLLNNIRVLPDNLSGMGDMNNIDLTKVTNKIQEIRGDQEGLKDGILTGIAIPRTLYAGDSTKWDAIKTSQRLASRISYFAGSLSYGVRLNACKIYKLITNRDLALKDVKSNLFKKTDADYNTEQTNAEIISNLIQQIGQIIDNTQRTLKESSMIDPHGYSKWIKQKLLVIDPELATVITDEKLNEYIEAVLKEKESGSGFD